MVLAEVNVKEIELLEDASGVLVKQIKPNFKALGPRFGKDMGLISKEIQGFSQEQINQIEKEGSLTIEVSGKNVNLTSEDVEILSQDIPGWLVANANGITLKSIKNLVTFHFDKKIIKIHIGIAIILAIEKTSVGVIFCYFDLLR